MRGREVLDFLIHLRPHYQLFILSGGYTAGGLITRTADFERATLFFFVVHLLLFGGATAYNSFFDRDEGPIGGLEHPPKMTAWMHPASLLIQLPGLGLGARLVGPAFAAIYASSMVFFWLYSTPKARWKGHPWLSFVAIAVSTGTNSVWLGHLAAGGTLMEPSALLAGPGVACILLSMYPVSQVFQLEDDTKRGDRTFAVAYGLPGVRRCFDLAYPIGVVLLGSAFWLRDTRLALVFGAVSVVAFLRVRSQLARVQGTREEYRPVMRMKYLTSFLFLAFLAGGMLMLELV